MNFFGKIIFFNKWGELFIRFKPIRIFGWTGITKGKTFKTDTLMSGKVKATFADGRKKTVVKKQVICYY